MPTLRTILPVIPPPMPAMSVQAMRDHSVKEPVTLPQGPTKPTGLPTKVWKDTRGYYRKNKPGLKK